MRASSFTVLLEELLSSVGAGVFLTSHTLLTSDSDVFGKHALENFWKKIRGEAPLSSTLGHTLVWACLEEGERRAGAT